MRKIVGGDEGRRPVEEVGRTPRLKVGCIQRRVEGIQRRVEGSGGVTHAETAEEVRKDWEVANPRNLKPFSLLTAVFALFIDNRMWENLASQE